MRFSIKKREALAAVCFIAALLLTVALLSALLMPKRADFGSTWKQYLQEEKNSIDVLLFGSSITYCDVVPAIIWQESGLSAYVMAGPEQTLPITYRYIREACRSQQPQAIFVEVTGAYFYPYQNFTKVNIGYMPWGWNRLAATFSAAKREEIPGLLFPLFNYHSRWSELTKADFTGLFPDADALAGYTFLADTEPMQESALRNEPEDAENYARNISYLQKTADFCAAQDIALYFYLAPGYQLLSDAHYEQLAASLSAIDGAHYLDLTLLGREIKADPALDYYDKLHFNWRGAEKFSRWLGQYLQQEGFTAAAERDSALWEGRLQYFQALCETK